MITFVDRRFSITPVHGRTFRLLSVSPFSAFSLLFVFVFSFSFSYAQIFFFLFLKKLAHFYTRTFLHSHMLTTETM